MPIQGVGRRYANLVCKKADIDMNKRAGELTDEEVKKKIIPFKAHQILTCFLWQIERVITIMQNPRQYKIPDWFLNRQKDHRDGKYSQILANQLEHKLREDLERLKKIRAHRGLRHYWG